MSLYGDIYHKRKVLLTGHTGFKGSWLSLWLSELGAEVTGIALSPEASPNHWDLLQLDISDNRVDIRNYSDVSGVFTAAQPEIVFHLAAQPLVRRSYSEPLETWSTNVMGTAHVLEACRKTQSVRSVVVVTTDKVYANREWLWGYRETDGLGGHDPYSGSKVAVEHLVDSYRKAFFEAEDGILLATARAGNVIGGGDWSHDRLIPDCVRAIRAGKPLEVRFPDATRPWQHVLECLNGYLLLGQKLLEGNRTFAEAWNFGPDASENRAVSEILTKLKNHWPQLNWQAIQGSLLHEAKLLYLDNTKSKAKLGWNPVWTLDQCLSATADWYGHHQKTGRVESRRQLIEFIESARLAGHDWTGDEPI